MCFSYTSREKKEREREMRKPSNTGRGINRGSEVFIDDRNLKFPIMRRFRGTPGHGAGPAPWWGVFSLSLAVML